MDANTQRADDTRIDPAITLNELVERHPRLLGVLESFGLDTCCGGSVALEVAVRRHGLDLGEVRWALQAVLASHPARDGEIAEGGCGCGCGCGPGPDRA